MPSVLIEVRQQYASGIETGIMNAVHSALMEAFKIPEDDRTTRLVVHEPHRFQISPEYKQPESYTHVTIDCFAGRSLDAKRKLYKCIVNNLAEFGIPKNHILIVLRDNPAENWGIQGGQAACDVNLGFEVKV